MSLHNLVFVLNAYVMHLVLSFITFIYMHLASHLGMLDEPCERYEHVELNLKFGFGGSIPKMEGLSMC